MDGVIRVRVSAWHALPRHERAGAPCAFASARLHAPIRLCQLRQRPPPPPRPPNGAHHTAPHPGPGVPWRESRPTRPLPRPAPLVRGQGVARLRAPPASFRLRPTTAHAWRVWHSRPRPCGASPTPRPWPLYASATTCRVCARATTCPTPGRASTCPTPTTTPPPSVTRSGRR